MIAMEQLYECDGAPTFGVSPPLAAAYGGDFGLASPGVYANVVSAVDGVVALPSNEESGRVISRGNEADRFVMGLLRASVDAVLVGAGTFRKDSGHLWLPEHICPEAGELFANLRVQLGLRPRPRLVVVTASGRIDTEQPALRDCIVITSPAGELRLREALPPGAQVMVIDSQPFDGRVLLGRLRQEGFQRILAEGGPTLLGGLLRQNLVNELFLTISPRLFGRQAGDMRKSLIEGVDLGGTTVKLVGVRRYESYLFLRYQL